MSMRVTEMNGNITRTCGDDPAKRYNIPRAQLILPAHAGMILNEKAVLTVVSDITRTCGDDPHRRFYRF